VFIGLTDGVHSALTPLLRHKVTTISPVIVTFIFFLYVGGSVLFPVELFDCKRRRLSLLFTLFMHSTRHIIHEYK